MNEAGFRSGSNGQGKTGQDTTGQDTTGQDTTGQDTTGQDTTVDGRRHREGCEVRQDRKSGPEVRARSQGQKSGTRARFARTVAEEACFSG